MTDLSAARLPEQMVLYHPIHGLTILEIKDFLIHGNTLKKPMMK